MKREPTFNEVAGVEKEDWEIELEKEKALREAEKESFHKKRLEELARKKHAEKGEEIVTKKDYNRGKFEKAEDLRIRRGQKKEKGNNNL